MRRENHSFLKNGSKIFARERLSFGSPLNRRAKLVLGRGPRTMHYAPPITLLRHPTGKSLVALAAFSRRLQEAFGAALRPRRQSQTAQALELSVLSAADEPGYSRVLLERTKNKPIDRAVPFCR
jgi:hypothetical protein